MQRRLSTARHSRRSALRLAAMGSAVLALARLTRARAMTYSAQELYDDFERADTVSGLGTAPTGQTWAVSGASLPRILSGQMTNDGGGAGYSYVQLSRKPARMAAQIQFGAGAAGGVAGLIAGIDWSLENMCHLVWGSTEWYFQVREAAGAFVSLASGVYALAPDTPYSVGVRYMGSQAVIELPDGTEVTVTDSRIARLNGKFLIYEPFWTLASGQGRVAFNQIEATVASASPPSAGVSAHFSIAAAQSRHHSLPQ